MARSARIFQFFKKLDLPIYLKFERDDFQDDLVKFLVDMQFSELKADEIDAMDRKMDLSDKKARVLSLKLASLVVAKQISRPQESDRFGIESIVPRENYRVYRYKGKAMMVYSYIAQEWELGCFKDFGSKAGLGAYRTIINRYLGMALAPLGIGGFWGSPVDEGVVLLRVNEALGEAVYIDFRNYRILTIEGPKPIEGDFTIIRLDNSLQSEKSLSREEVYGMLAIHSTFLDYMGASVPVRQIFHSISTHFRGCVFPKDNFKPRLDLEA